MACLHLTICKCIDEACTYFIHNENANHAQGSFSIQIVSIMKIHCRREKCNTEVRIKGQTDAVSFDLNTFEQKGVINL